VANVENSLASMLKISNDKVNKFLAAAELAQIDWRDALMATGFGNDLERTLEMGRRVSQVILQS